MAKITLDYVQVFKDRHGRPRHYYRRKGFPRVALPGPAGSAEFMAAYAEAEARAPRTDPVAPRVQPRSINALVIEYYRSTEWSDLAASTQRGYRNILDRFREQHGTKSVSGVQPHHLEAIFHGMAATPGAAVNLRKRLRRLFRLAVRLGWRADNPVSETEVRRKKSPGFTPWSEDDIAAFETHWASGTRQRRALALLLYTGQRRSDVTGMGRQHVRDGRISVSQQKGGKRLMIPLHPALKAELAAAPAGDLTFITTAYGEPFSQAGFTSWFVTAAKAAGLTGRTPHGLRKAAGRRLAEAGCTTKQIASILGHDSLNEAEKYTRDAEQSWLADDAMVRLVEAETRTPRVKPV